MKLRLILSAFVGFAASAFPQTYYLPPGVTNIRAMVVGGTPLRGGTSQIWRDFCLAQRIGLAQTVGDLPTIATVSGHPEIANAPFATCGTSAGASAAASAVIANPARGIAVVEMHRVMLAAGNDGFNANRSGENGDFPSLDFSGVYGVPMIPITPGKNYVAHTADPIFNFRVTADATVFIAHGDQGTPRPAWLSTYTNSGEQLVVTSGNLNSNAPRYTLFKNDCAANSIVSCGTNAPAPSGQMYLTLVKPLGAQALPSVSVSASDTSATEGGDTGAFTITRTGATTSALTVNFTMSGSATGGTDCTSLGTSAVIPAGQSSVALAVAPIDDALVEGTETVTLSLPAARRMRSERSMSRR